MLSRLAGASSRRACFHSLPAPFPVKPKFRSANHSHRGTERQRHRGRRKPHAEARRRGEKEGGKPLHPLCSLWLPHPHPHQTRLAGDGSPHPAPQTSGLWRGGPRHGHKPAKPLPRSGIRVWPGGRRAAPGENSHRATERQRHRGREKESVDFSSRTLPTKTRILFWDASSVSFDAPEVLWQGMDMNRPRTRRPLGEAKKMPLVADWRGNKMPVGGISVCRKTPVGVDVCSGASPGDRT